MGDFNFVENKYNDTASHSTYYDPTGVFKSEWTVFLAHYSLREVHQPTHTYIEAATHTTSRLDRHYASSTEAEWACRFFSTGLWSWH